MYEDILDKPEVDVDDDYADILDKPEVGGVNDYADILDKPIASREPTVAPTPAPVLPTDFQSEAKPERMDLTRATGMEALVARDAQQAVMAKEQGGVEPEQLLPTPPVSKTPPQEVPAERDLTDEYSWLDAPPTFKDQNVRKIVADMAKIWKDPAVDPLQKAQQLDRMREGASRIGEMQIRMAEKQREVLPGVRELMAIEETVAGDVLRTMAGAGTSVMAMGNALVQGLAELPVGVPERAREWLRGNARDLAEQSVNIMEDIGKQGGMPAQVAQEVGQQALTTALRLAALQGTGLMGSKSMVLNAVKMGMFTAATTSGTAAERTMAGVRAATLMATPLIAGKMPTAATAVLLDTALNIGLSNLYGFYDWKDPKVWIPALMMDVAFAASTRPGMGASDRARIDSVVIRVRNAYVKSFGAENAIPEMRNAGKRIGMSPAQINEVLPKAVEAAAKPAEPSVPVARGEVKPPIPIPAQPPKPIEAPAPVKPIIKPMLPPPTPPSQIPDKGVSPLPTKGAGEGALTLEPARVELLKGPGLEGGPGAAAAKGSGEFIGGTALKNATAELERASLGLPEATPTEKKAMVTEWANSKQTIADDPLAPRRIVDYIISDPSKGLSDVESAILLRHKVSLQNEVNKAASDLNTVKTDSERVDVQTRFDNAMGELETVMDAAKVAGTAWGRTGRWRQMIAAEDYTLGNMLLRAKAKKGGNELTPTEKLKIQMLQKELDTAQKVLAEIKAKAKVEPIKVDETASKQQAEKVFQDIVGKKGIPVKRELPTSKELAGVVSKNLIRELMRQQVESGVKNLDEAINNVHVIVSKSNPDITSRQVRDIFSDYGKFKIPGQEPTEITLRDLRAQSQKRSQLEDVMSGKVPLKTGMGRDEPSQTVRELSKQVRVAMKKMGIVTRDPEKQLKTSLDAIKTRLNNNIDDLEKAITTREKMVVNKADIPYDAEAKALKAKRDVLRQQYDKMFPKQPLTDAERYDLAIKSAKHSMDIWEKKLSDAKKGIFPPEIKKGVATTKEMIDIRKQRDATKIEFEVLRDQAMPDRKDKLALQMYGKRLDRQIADTEAKIKAGVLPEKKVKTKITGAEEKEFELAQVKQRWNQLQFELQLAQRTKWQIVGQGVEEVGNTLRAFVASFDIGHLRRQGGLHFLSHPLESIGLLPETFRAIKSEKEAFRIDKKIRDDPIYLRGKKAGLFLHTEDTGLNNMEDVYRGKWWREVPGIAASGRAYTTGLNLVRQTIFKRFAKQMSLDGDGKLTDEDYKTTANFINNWTGRGGLGKLEMAARGLADIFFSPRLATSRFKVLLSPLTGFRAYGKSGKARKLIAKEYARYLAGVATYWSTIYAGANAFLGPKGDKWDINFDILSSDFGKVRIGNTRIDPLSGLQQPLVLMARTLMGKKTTLKGKEVPLYGPEVGYGDDTIGTLMGRFVRSKYSPGMGVANDIITRRHYFGEPINAKEMLYGVTPMVLRDTYESMNDMYNTFGTAGIPSGIVLGLMSNVGEGIQTYEQKTKTDRKLEKQRGFLDWKPTKFMGTEIEKSLGLQ